MFDWLRNLLYNTDEKCKHCKLETPHMKAHLLYSAANNTGCYKAYGMTVERHEKV